MNISEINTVLDVVSQELRGAELVAAYDEALYEEDMELVALNYANDSYDLDAAYYGEIV